MIDKDVKEIDFPAALDEAILHGNIQVYYQPIVRTLTEQVAGVEALVRWMNADGTMISPGRFLPALEQAGKIYELDCAVLDEICRMLHERIKAGRAVVPVSINLSWRDFSRGDALGFFEQTLSEYDIPRKLIRIELGERALVEDADELKVAIENFRAKGYQVWLDDFGSEYSSLHTLKDFDVDVIKLDMRFLSAFTEKAKRIVTAVVNMAKTLGVRTLAEGAERAEHVLFLHEIGCEMVQGYYYGSPMPIEKLEAYIMGRGLSPEEPKASHYYERIGACIRQSTDPMAFLGFDGESFFGFYANAPYLKQIESLGYATFEEAVAAINERGTARYDKFRSFIDAPRRSGQEEVFFYTSHENYLRTSIQLIAEFGSHAAFRISTLNLTQDRRAQERMQLDKSLRHIYQMFDSVHILDLRRDAIRPLFTNNVVFDGILKEEHGLELLWRKYCAANVHPDDQKHFTEYVDPETLGRRLREQKARHMISDLFRLKDRDGNFSWKEVAFLVVPESRLTRFLVCIKDIVSDHRSVTVALLSDFDDEAELAAARDKTAQATHDGAMLWKCLMQTKRTNYFWKDKDLRFRGASKGFLDAYGFSSVDDILGKTDEDVGWHVDDSDMHRAELSVVQEGATIANQQGECIIRGRLRPIIYTKRPIYDHGEIVGLLGVFEDMEAIEQRFDALSHSFLVDSLTGLLNATGCVQTLFRYQQEKKLHGKHYGMLILNVKSFDRIVKNYGDSASKELLWSMADGVLAAAGADTVVARLAGATFAVLGAFESKAEIEPMAQAITERLQDVHSMLGDEVTVRIETRILTDGDGEISPRMIYEAAWDGTEQKE